MSEPLKLFSLNIELNRHYDRWIPFVQKNNFDVICLQEVYKSDLKMFEEKLGCQMYFAPMENIIKENTDQKDEYGLAIGFSIEHEEPQFDYYTQPYDPESTAPEIGDFWIYTRTLFHGLCNKDGQDFYIGTTHFTWTPDGDSNEEQARDLESFLKLVDTFKSIIFCGDMNAPRGRLTFDTIAQKYQDHIPTKYITSLDLELRDKPVVPDPNLMVDALFSTDDYRTENVELVSGLSDHMGIIADIYRKD